MFASAATTEDFFCLFGSGSSGLGSPKPGYLGPVPVDSATPVSRCLGLSGFTLSTVAACFALANICEDPVSAIDALRALLLRPVGSSRRLIGSAFGYYGLC